MDYYRPYESLSKIKSKPVLEGNINLAKTLHRRAIFPILHYRERVKAQELISRLEFIKFAISARDENNVVADIWYDTLFKKENEEFCVDDSFDVDEKPIPLKKTDVRFFLIAPDFTHHEQIIHAKSDYSLHLTLQLSIDDISKYFHDDGFVYFMFEFIIYLYHNVDEITLQDMCVANLSYNLLLNNVHEVMEVAEVYRKPNLYDQCVNLLQLFKDEPEVADSEKVKELEESLQKKILHCYDSIMIG